MKLPFDTLLALILGVPEADLHDVGTVPRGPYMRAYALAKKIEVALAEQQPTQMGDDAVTALVSLGSPDGSPYMYAVHIDRYEAANTLAAVLAYPDSGDWHAQMRTKLALVARGYEANKIFVPIVGEPNAVDILNAAYQWAIANGWESLAGSTFRHMIAEAEAKAANLRAKATTEETTEEN